MGKEEQPPSPLSKKQKLDLEKNNSNPVSEYEEKSGESKSKEAEEVYYCNPKDLALDSGEDEIECISESEDQPLHEYYCSKFELIDFSSSSPIVVDLQQLEEQHKDNFVRSHFDSFVSQCYDRNSLILYDNPPGGYRHQLGECIPERDRDIAAFALEWYLQHCQKESKLELVYVDKITCQWMPHAFYYVTFRVRDVLTDKEITMQAEVFEIDRRTKRNWILGMIRDATNDRVLAVLRVKLGPSEDKATIKFGEVPPKVAEMIVSEN